MKYFLFLLILSCGPQWHGSIQAMNLIQTVQSCDLRYTYYIYNTGAIYSSDNRKINKLHFEGICANEVNY